MPIYRRKQIIEKFLERLEAILKTNGYATDAGQHIFFWSVNLGPDDPQLAISIIPQDTVRDVQFGQKIIRLPIEIQAVAKDNLDDSLLVVEDLVGDIKRAIESPETAKRDLGGLALKLDSGEERPLPRPEGSTVVGVRVEYSVMYSEKWGDPEATE